MSNSFELICHHEAWIECDFVAACMLSKFISGQRAGLRRRKARVQIAASTLSGNSLRQTVHTHRASVHQAAKLVAALLRAAVVTAAWRKVMAAYRRVYYSHHLQADCQEPGSAPEPCAR